MKCEDCIHWILQRKTIYGDNSEVVTFSVANGHGLCEELNTNTAPDFGCTKFVPGAHIVVTLKNGEPWQYWKMGPCPGCQGVGNRGAACHRCAGTGKVRYYDDGFVGEEQTRLHPKEVEMRKTKPIPVTDPGTLLQPLPPPSAL